MANAKNEDDDTLTSVNNVYLFIKNQYEALCNQILSEVDIQEISKRLPQRLEEYFQRLRLIFNQLSLNETDLINVKEIGKDLEYIKLLIDSNRKLCLDSFEKTQAKISTLTRDHFKYITAEILILQNDTRSFFAAGSYLIQLENLIFNSFYSEHILLDYRILKSRLYYQLKTLLRAIEVEHEHQLSLHPASQQFLKKIFQADWVDCLREGTFLEIQNQIKLFLLSFTSSLKKSLSAENFDLKNKKTLSALEGFLKKIRGLHMLEGVVPEFDRDREIILSSITNILMGHFEAVQRDYLFTAENTSDKFSELDLDKFLKIYEFFDCFPSDTDLMPELHRQRLLVHAHLENYALRVGEQHQAKIEHNISSITNNDIDLRGILSLAKDIKKVILIFEKYPISSRLFFSDNAIINHWQTKLVSHAYNFTSQLYSNLATEKLYVVVKTLKQLELLVHLDTLLTGVSFASLRDQFTQNFYQKLEKIPFEILSEHERENYTGVAKRLDSLRETQDALVDAYYQRSLQEVEDRVNRQIKHANQLLESVEPFTEKEAEKFKDCLSHIANIREYYLTHFEFTFKNNVYVVIEKAKLKLTQHLLSQINNLETMVLSNDIDVLKEIQNCKKIIRHLKDFLQYEEIEPVIKKLESNAKQIPDRLIKQFSIMAVDLYLQNPPKFVVQKFSEAVKNGQVDYQKAKQDFNRCVLEKVNTELGKLPPIRLSNPAVYRRQILLMEAIINQLPDEVVGIVKLQFESIKEGEQPISLSGTSLSTSSRSYSVPGASMLKTFFSLQWSRPTNSSPPTVTSHLASESKP